MKLITPKFLKALNLGDPVMKITRTKISFNQSAVDLLVLKPGVKFVIEDHGNGLLYYADSANVDAFAIGNTYKYGGAYANHEHLLEYLSDRSVKELTYLIGELKDGKRVLMFKKKEINKPKS